MIEVSQQDTNRVLTEREGRTKEYWPEIVQEFVNFQF